MAVGMSNGRTNKHQSVVTGGRRASGERGRLGGWVEGSRIGRERGDGEAYREVYSLVVKSKGTFFQGAAF